MHTWNLPCDRLGILSISSILPQILPQTSSQTQGKHWENSEFPEWSTKHPLFSLEISGNAKCWGPSVFLCVFRKTGLSPRSRTGGPWDKIGGQRRRRSDSTFYFKQRQSHAPQRGACHCQERIRQLVVLTPGSSSPQPGQTLGLDSIVVRGSSRVSTSGESASPTLRAP